MVESAKPKTKEELLDVSILSQLESKSYCNQCNYNYTKIQHNICKTDGVKLSLTSNFCNKCENIFGTITMIAYCKKNKINHATEMND